MGGRNYPFSECDSDENNGGSACMTDRSDSIVSSRWSAPRTGLFIPRAHRQVLAELIRGILAGQTFVALTGEPGIGKTTLLDVALAALEERGFRVRRMENPLRSPLRMTQTMCELPGNSAGSIGEEVEPLFNTITYNEDGTQFVLVLDDAQCLQADDLQIVASINTLGIRHQQVILAGRPEFWTLLANPKLQELEQRIKVRPVMLPLGGADARDYVISRLKQMGWLGIQALPAAALGKIVEHGNGIPGRLDRILTQCLLATRRDCRQLRPDTVDAAARMAADPIISVAMQTIFQRQTIADDPPRRRRHAAFRPRSVACVAAVLLGGIGTATWQLSAPSDSRQIGSYGAATSPNPQSQTDIALADSLAPPPAGGTASASPGAVAPVPDVSSVRSLEPPPARAAPISPVSPSPVGIVTQKKPVEAPDPRQSPPETGAGQQLPATPGAATVVDAAASSAPPVSASPGANAANAVSSPAAGQEMTDQPVRVPEPAAAKSATTAPPTETDAASGAGQQLPATPGAATAVDAAASSAPPVSASPGANAANAVSSPTAGQEMTDQPVRAPGPAAATSATTAPPTEADAASAAGQQLPATPGAATAVDAAASSAPPVSASPGANAANAVSSPAAGQEMTDQPVRVPEPAAAKSATTAPPTETDAASGAGQQLPATPGAATAVDAAASSAPPVSASPGANAANAVSSPAAGQEMTDQPVRVPEPAAATSATTAPPTETDAASGAGQQLPATPGAATAVDAAASSAPPVSASPGANAANAVSSPAAGQEMTDQPVRVPEPAAATSATTAPPTETDAASGAGQQLPATPGAATAVDAAASSAPPVSASPGANAANAVSSPTAGQEMTDQPVRAPGPAAATSATTAPPTETDAASASAVPATGPPSRTPVPTSAPPSTDTEPQTGRTAAANPTAPASQARQSSSGANSTSAPAQAALKPAVLPPEILAELLRRGDAMLAIGDIASARLLYAKAAESGDPRAETQLGKTYDSLFLAQVGALGLATDPITAAKWYHKAAASGDTEALERLRRLGVAGDAASASAR